MKANEAPEKIYIFEEDLQHEDHIVMYGINQDKDIRGLVEYTRTDAFIEKACEFIRKGGNRGDAYIVTEFGEEVFDFVQLAEDFRKYIEGE